MCWRRSILRLLSLLLLALDQALASDLPHYQDLDPVTMSGIGKLHLVNSARQPVLWSDKDDHIGHHVVVECFGRKYDILLTNHIPAQNPSEPTHHFCLYQGLEVKSRKDAMITLCQSVYGFFRTHHSIFLIEPSDLQYRHLETDNGSIIAIKRHRTGSTSRLRISRQSTRQTPFTIKVLISADVHLTQAHRSYPFMDGTNIKNYLLTVMAIVDSLFRDSSFGSRISIAVSRMDYGNFFVSRKDDGNKTLRAFCTYQNNWRSFPGLGYDMAILLLASPVKWKGEMARTHPDQLCNNKFSCAIVRDIGLNSAFIIARQVGLWLGLPEDDIGQALCSGRGNNGIMSPLWKEADLWSWSSCSRSAMQAILKQKLLTCLHDTLTGYEENLPYPSFMRQFLLDSQCRMRHHTDAVACNNHMKKDCEQLQCLVGRECLPSTFLDHWPDETPCGNLSSTTRMFCYQKQCLNRSMINMLEKMKNLMSEWTPWSPCSRTCGGGITQSNRTCLGHRSQCGGRQSEHRFMSCNVKECPHSVNSSREDQCSQYNIKDKYYYPLYKKGHRHECKLYCKTDADSDLLPPNTSNVIDGTQCHPDSFDVCVQGKCKYAGCDHILGSVSTADECGVCRGDGSTCLLKKGHKKRVMGNPAFTFPVGSAVLQLVIRDITHCYFVVFEGQGQKRLEISGKMNDVFYIGGVLWKYRLHDSHHKFTTLGPLSATVRIEVHFYQNVTTYNVGWSYYERLPQPIFEWRQNWSECSKECQGYQQHVLKCYKRVDGSEYPSIKCNNIPVPTGSPQSPEKACNIDCHFEWRHSSSCSDYLRCGQSFTITVGHICYKVWPYGSDQVNPRLCPSPMPSPEILTCQGKPCPTVPPSRRYVSVLSPASQNLTCSSSCGIGYIPSYCHRIPESALTSTHIRCKTLDSFPVYRMSCSGDLCPQSDSASSCAAWVQKGYQNDGEYTIAVQGKRIKLYCHEMISHPTEYLTLPAGPAKNFASIYSYQWRNPSGTQECPDVHKLEASQLDNYSGAGVSHFSKVRFLSNTMEIQTDDLRFSETNGSRPEFGMGGDCFASPGCTNVDVKGRFQIDLQGTGLELANREQWITKTILGTTVTHTTTLYYHPAPVSSQALEGHCGLCATCFVPNKKLKVKFVKV